jgi:hypothetical protein
MIVNAPQAIYTIIVSYNWIQNQGFETGVEAPWTLGLNGQITNVAPHIGIYCCQLYPSGGRSCIQTLAMQIPVETIRDWLCYYKQGILNQSYWIAIYDDASETGFGLSDNSGTWVSSGSLPGSLTAGRKVAQVQLLGGNVGQTYFDDCVLNAPFPRNTVLLTYPPQS